MQRLQIENLSLTTANNALRDTQTALTDKIARLTDEITALKQQVEDARSDAATAKARIAELVMELQTVQLALEQERQTVLALRTANAALQEREESREKEDTVQLLRAAETQVTPPPPLSLTHTHSLFLFSLLFCARVSLFTLPTNA